MNQQNSLGHGIGYKDLFIEEKRIQNGKKFISENIKTLKKAESRFGVPKEIITSILGVETRYGKNYGLIQSFGCSYNAEF